MLDLASLNPQQRLAVESIHGPVLILAGAGTGKTRVITYRIAHLIEKGVPADQILAVTFTNKAAREMKERVGKLLRRPPRHKGEKRAGPTVCTFHSFCARLLRQHIESLGYKRNFVIYNESEQLGVMKRILSQISADGESTDPNAILACISRWKNGSSVVHVEESVKALAQHLRQRYERALHACNAVDFDDLLQLALRLLREHPEILESCRARFRYVMVDEYQDTNAVQFELLQMLTAEHRNLCVVGDDDQSIYGWRGAEIANLLNLESHFRDVKIVKLEQNYRSTSAILSTANALIKNNVRRRGKQLWSQNGPGTKITLHAFSNDEEEARTIVEEIEYVRLALRVPWGEQAVLFRTNQQSRSLEMALRKAEVRYHLIGGQSYFDRREVKDFLAYLKVILNPHDDISLLRIANVPARGLSEATMERLLSASQERHCSVFAAMKHTDVQGSFLARAGSSVRTFVELIENARQTLEAASPGRMGEWAERFISGIGYFDELRRTEKNEQTAENRVRNLRELLVSLDDAELEGNGPVERLENFLETLMLDSERESEKEKAGDAVTLITMHSCKGLEFPHVYIVGIEEGLLPHSRSKLENTLDEERRLFYVAITRAMRTLTLSYCLGRQKYGQTLPCHPSRFLMELPVELIEHADEKGKAQVSADAGTDFFATLRAAAS